MIPATPPDIIILIILLFFTFKGFKNGFIKEAQRIIGMIGGFVSAYKFSHHVIPYIEIYFINPTIQNITSYLIIFCITLVIINFFALALHKFFEFILLGWLNRILGTLLGLIKGVLITSIIIFILDIAPLQIREKLYKDSELYKICSIVKNRVINFSKLSYQIDDLQENINQSLKPEKINNILNPK